MSGDIRIDLEEAEGALSIVDNDLLLDAGLETAIILSLFTDMRADKEDNIPDGSTDLRGWWGDVVSEDPIGSSLWLLLREKINGSTREKFKAAAINSLKWMIDDSVAQEIKVDVTSLLQDSVEFTVQVLRPAFGNSVNFKYYYNWQAQLFGRI